MKRFYSVIPVLDSVQRSRWQLNPRPGSLAGVFKKISIHSDGDPGLGFSTQIKDLKKITNRDDAVKGG